MERLKKDLMFPLLVALISAVVGSFITFWISNQYYQPQVNWLARGCSYFEDTCYYYKLENLSIGNIYIENDGYRPDSNISVIIDGTIDKNDISVVDLTSSYQIQNLDGNKTLIKISTLQPTEDADITFKTQDQSDTYSINQIYSDSGRIKSLLSPSSWWQFNLGQIIFISILAIIFGGIGFLAARRYYKSILEI